LYVAAGLIEFPCGGVGLVVWVSAGLGCD